MTTTNIEWTDRVWNPTTGCDQISPGCAHCYAKDIAHRFWSKQYPPVLSEGCAIKTRPRVFEDVLTHADRLDQPLHWKKPARIFVNSMSDLFHEDVPDSFIDQVFSVMHLAEGHVFQILTKRAQRMLDYMRSRTACDPGHVAIWTELGPVEHDGVSEGIKYRVPWPLPNVWLGVSVENQQYADERIPLLLQTPAAVRFISAEPLLGPITFAGRPWCPKCQWWAPDGTGGTCTPPHNGHAVVDILEMLDWVIVGGESGPRARPFNVRWARSIVTQCRAAGVPVFVKQLGADIRDRNDAGFMGEEPEAWPDHVDNEDRVEHDLDGTRDGYQGAPVRVHLRSKKGGDPSEWPEDLRVREFPA